MEALDLLITIILRFVISLMCLMLGFIFLRSGVRASKEGDWWGILSLIIGLSVLFLTVVLLKFTLGNL